MICKPWALDLFCGIGGTALGLKQAGFYVVGIDIKKPPRYYGDMFIQADIHDLPVDPADFDFIWASPPCQAFSCGSARWREVKDYPDLISTTREILAGHPYTAIENVSQAPIRPDLVLYGYNFGLGPQNKGEHYFGSYAEVDSDGLWRKRHFELSFFCWQLPRQKLVRGRTLCITKRLSAKCHFYRRKLAGEPGKVTADEGFKVMGYPEWVLPDLRAHANSEKQVEDGLAESVPPPYSHYIGKECLARMREADYETVRKRSDNALQKAYAETLRDAEALNAPPF